MGRPRGGEFSTVLGSSGSEKRASAAAQDRSLSSRGEVEITGERAQKMRKKCVETRDTARYPSRCRLSTGGCNNSLPQVRLPARNALRTPRKKSLETSTLSYSATLYHHWLYGDIAAGAEKSSRRARGANVTLIELPALARLLTRLWESFVKKL